MYLSQRVVCALESGPEFGGTRVDAVADVGSIPTFSNTDFFCVFLERAEVVREEDATTPSCIMFLRGE